VRKGKRKKVSTAVVFFFKDFLNFWNLWQLPQSLISYREVATDVQNFDLFLSDSPFLFFSSVAQEVALLFL
jgi:hypothetical protein